MSDTKPSRVTWVDLARGVGILLVVLGHAAGGLIDTKTLQGTDALRIVFLTIYSFHMSLFFILSGLFVAGRVKSNAKGFITGTFTKIGRAYFTWAIIQFVVIMAMGEMLNHPPEGEFWPQFVAIIWTPVSQFWFLYVLFFMQIMAWLFIPSLGSIGFFAATVATWVAYQIFGLPKSVDYPTVNQFFDFLISFGLGVAIGPRLNDIKVLREGRPLAALAAALCWLAFFAAAYIYSTQSRDADWLMTFNGPKIAYVVNNVVFFPAALAGAAMVILACCSNLIPLRKVFEYLGQNSMPIFLTHILIIAGTRIILLKYFPSIDANLLMVVISLTGLIGSVVFFEIMKKLKLAKLLAMV